MYRQAKGHRDLPTLQFDKDYTKETTLEWYLNFIWLGDRCRGVGAAAMNYFGKPVQELTLAECASPDLHHQ